MRGRRHRGLWVLAAFVPFGLGAWAGFAYAGARAHVTRWKVYAVLYAVGALAAFILPSLVEDDTDASSLAGGLIIAVWVLGIGHSFVARPHYLRRVNTIAATMTAAEERLAQRREALELARERPELALELGVGRPDRPGAMDAGLVDVNSAPPDLIERLPGIDRATARRIVAVREQLDGFESLEDFGMTMDLDGETVEDLRGKVVFLPR
jgi:DNA uptake protein ComE-like DNA-binding protein